MKDKQFFLDKSNIILQLFEQKKNEGFNTTISDSDIISEMELLFFGFNQNYPALSDLKELKENYLDNMRKGNRTERTLKKHLLRFVDFINDYQ